MVYKKVESLRKALKKRKKKRSAKRKSKQLQAEREARDRRERIEANDPEGIREGAAATKRQVELLADDLGATREQAREVVDGASERIDSAKEAGGALSEFDVDGDGDTGFFEAMDSIDDDLSEPLAGEGGATNRRASADPGEMTESATDPVMEPIGEPGDQADPLGEPLDEEIDF